MDYLHTHQNAKIRYNASNMKMYMNSDTAYLVASKSKSRIVGYFYLSDQYKKGSGNITPTLNGYIQI